VQRLRDVPIKDRLGDLSVSSCRPLRDAKEAVQYALARFHESWSAYRTVTPTLYLIHDEAPGAFVTLGRLRKRYGLSWETLGAVLEALSEGREVHGFILAAPGVGGDPLRPLFTLQGHERGERQYGALDLALLVPFEHPFVTEFDLGADAWGARWAEAASNVNLPLRAGGR